MDRMRIHASNPLYQSFIDNKGIKFATKTHAQKTRGQYQTGVMFVTSLMAFITYREIKQAVKAYNLYVYGQSYKLIPLPLSWQST